MGVEWYDGGGVECGGGVCGVCVVSGMVAVVFMVVVCVVSVW